MRVPTLVMRCCISYYSYIKPQHAGGWQSWLLGCISYYSYIKPQRNRIWDKRGAGCISYYSYIKPQHAPLYSPNFRVVYRTIPTSNHNGGAYSDVNNKLYIVLFLHQTTTLCIRYISRHELYIVLFLHQTTTHGKIAHSDAGCISYYSYIKPQPLAPA